MKQNLRETNRKVYANRLTAVSPKVIYDKHHFPSNEVTSSRYTWWNFVALNLYEQFHHITNLTFFTLCLLYLFATGATNAFNTAIPLIVAMGIAMIKDGVYDIFRHLHDKKLNCEPVEVLSINPAGNNAKWLQKPSQKINVGDIVRCWEGDRFPCDMIILASKDIKRVVHVTTVNLDGESNIKTYHAFRETQSVYSKFLRTEEIYPLSGNSFDLLLKAEVGPPTADFHSLEGRLFPDINSDSYTSISAENLLLRGAKLMNTESVIGLVAYTGRDTKLSLNSIAPYRKYTYRDAILNEVLSFFLLSSVLLALILTIIGTVWSSHNMQSLWYITSWPLTTWSFVQNWFTFLFLTNYLLPISLIITIELQELYLSFLISNDLELYDVARDIRSSASTVHMVDELGQIEYLFSDKTGTITQNDMVLKTCAMIETGFIYSVEKEDLYHIEDFKLFQQYKSNLPSDHPTSMQAIRRHSFLKEANGVPEDLLTLLTAAALCHTVEVKRDEASNPPVITYQASSTDEKAFIEAARNLGVELFDSKLDEDRESSRILTIRYHRTKLGCSPSDHSSLSSRLNGELDDLSQYIVDAILEFDAVRKRMSVLVRHPDGSCHIYSKGSETSMVTPEVCSQSPSEHRSLAMKRSTDFATTSLRALVFATRQLSAQEYWCLVDDWFKAMGLFGQERQTALTTQRRRIESGLRLLGVTGVEDRLQPGVRECLYDLRMAGIKVWILTGDKEETAIAVSQDAGHFPIEMSLLRMTNCTDIATTASRLFQNLERLDIQNQLGPPQDVNVFAVDDNDSDDELAKQDLGPTVEEVEDIVEASFEATVKDAKQSDIRGEEIIQLRELHARLMSFARPDGRSRLVPRLPGRKKRRIRVNCRETIGLVVDGPTLQHALHPSLRAPFLDLCLNVSTVVCCRMTPIQKLSVIQLVQVGLSGGGRRKPVTAAVGDGGNDVAMLQQASIGIGVHGREGNEAVRAADYAIPEFQLLRRLLLVHGHWNYHRITSTMLISYQKCVVFVTISFWTSFICGFSGGSWFSSILFTLYNLTMTSLPTLLFGMFERYLTDSELLTKSHLYRTIRGNRNLRAVYILAVVADAFWQGSVIFLSAFLFLAGGQVGSSSAVYYQVTTESHNQEVGQFDYSLCGCAVYVYAVLSVNLRIALFSREFTWPTAVGLLFTLVSNCALLFILQATVSPSDMLYQSYTKLARSPCFWFVIPIVLLTSNVPGLIWRVYMDCQRKT